MSQLPESSSETPIPGPSHRASPSHDEENSPLCGQRVRQLSNGFKTKFPLCEKDNCEGPPVARPTEHLSNISNSNHKASVSSDESSDIDEQALSENQSEPDSGHESSIPSDDNSVDNQKVVSDIISKQREEERVRKLEDKYILLAKQIRQYQELTGNWDDFSDCGPSNLPQTDYDCLSNLPLDGSYTNNLKVLADFCEQTSKQLQRNKEAEYILLAKQIKQYRELTGDWSPLLNSRPTHSKNKRLADRASYGNGQKGRKFSIEDEKKLLKQEEPGNTHEELVVEIDKTPPIPTIRIVKKRKIE